MRVGKYLIVIALLMAAESGESVSWKDDEECEESSMALTERSGTSAQPVHATVRPTNEHEKAILAQLATHGRHAFTLRDSGAKGPIDCSVKPGKGKITLYCELDKEVGFGFAGKAGLLASVNLVSTYHSNHTVRGYKPLDVWVTLELGVKASILVPFKGYVDIDKRVTVKELSIITGGDFEAPGCYEVFFFTVCSGMSNVSFNEATKEVQICASMIFDWKFPQSMHNHLALEFVCKNIDLRQAFH